MSNNIFTYANNYNGFASGNVNERTGTFNFSVDIASINANGLRGPILDMSLSLNPSSKADQGFGPGLVLGLPSIDLHNHIFINTTGVAVKLDVLNTIPNEPTLQDFKITRESNDYKVIYATGETDYFKTNNHGEFAILVRRENPLGLGLTFKWYNMSKLQSIIDDEGVEFFSREYNKTEMSLLSGRYFINTMEERGNYFCTLPYENKGGYNDAGIYTVYTELESATGRKIITQVQLPDDSMHTLTYGKYLYTEGGIQLPVVSEHKIEKSGNTIRKIAYDFDPEGDRGNNVYGRNANIPYQEYSDTLYRIRHPYFYKTEKTEVDHLGVSTVILSTYDKFHNLVEIKKQCGDCEKLEKMSFYVNDDKDVLGQTNKFKLQKKHTVKYNQAGKEREEVMHYDYDDGGNILSEYNENSQVRIDYEYHDTRTVKSDECPVYPFIHFLKQQRVTDVKESLSRVVAYRKYKQLDTTLPHSVVIKEDHNWYSNTLIKYDHYSSGPDLGRRKSQSLNHNNADSTDSYEYSKTDNLLTVTETSHYNSPISDSMSNITVLDTFSNQLMSKEEQGLKVQSYYYFDGRLEIDITAENTVNAFQNEYYYDDKKNIVTMVDQLGNVKKSEYDAAGQITNVRLTIPGIVENFLSLSKTYNQMGQLISETGYDTNLTPTGRIPVQQKTWNLTTQYQYDGWGEIKTIVTPDNQTKFDSFNPITQVSKSGIQGLAYKETTIDPLTRTYKVENFDGKGNKINMGLTSYYDGFELVSKTVTDLGVTTDYLYDELDRVTTTTKSSTDTTPNVITETVYSPYHINAEFVKSISVNGHVLGVRDYDGYGRLLAETVGSNQTQYEFDQGQMHYKNIILTDKQRLDVLFDHNLGEYYEIGAEAKELHEKTGLVLSTTRSNTDNKITCEHRFDGLPSKELTGLNKNVYDYTLSGSPLASSFGNLDFESIQYDNLQRISVKQDALNKIDYQEYDAFSRVTKIAVTGESNLNITIDYSNFPEQVVTSTIGEDNSLIETIDFGRDGKVSAKTTELNGITLVESYAYNAFSQLTIYDAVGVRAPKDQFGNVIKSQIFSYDEFGNVLTLNTTFRDDEKDYASFSYAEDSPTQLIGVKHTHTSYSDLDFSESYDDFGRLLKDEKGYQYTFNEYGEMQTVYDENGIELSEYTYDAVGRLASQSIVGQPPLEYIYAGDTQISQKQGDVKTKISSLDNRLLSKQISGGGVNITNTYFVDSENTPLKVITSGDENKSSEYLYTPYGYRSEGAI